MDKVSEFLRVAESVGIDRGEIPDLTRAPASLLEALEAHLIHLEGGRVPSSGLQGQVRCGSFGIRQFQSKPIVNVLVALISLLVVSISSISSRQFLNDWWVPNATPCWRR